MKKTGLHIALLLSLLTWSCSPSVDGLLVKDVAAFEKAVKAAKAGDKIVLANGVWKDVELVFTGEGTAENPITLTVEEKGKVTLEGQSNLRMAGEHLVLEGFVFKNGFTPTSEVISLRRDKEYLCNHCRVTECVIDDYNQPERFESDYWVGIYGKNNRFDHNLLVGKRNQGVTVAVRLNTEASRENNHRLDHNYFGYHPILGSNGGETLRIGTSHYSLTNSNTLVDHNYFDRCNGEHEIISNKSCQNTFRNNTFFECQGTLTMRHGNETLVDSNYFYGNGKANTGGIRIINETQTVTDNYCEGLTGYRFRGALVIMNGVPNSPPNRYFQVKDSKASGNTFVNCDHIQLCAGSDEERSATPINTLVANNTFYHDTKENIFTVYDDISGIRFEGNIMQEGMNALQSEGFSFQNLDPKELKTEPPTTPENTGVSWYVLPEYEIRFKTGKVIAAAAGENTLLEAIKSSQPGDIIELTESGSYHMTKDIPVLHPVSVRAVAGLGEKPAITFEKTSLFNIENGGTLELEGLYFNGKECRDKPLNAVIRTSRYSMINNYKLMIRDCDFDDMDINHSFDIIKVYKNTFADSILLQNCSFSEVTGHVLALNKETDDIGIYNAENVVLQNCQFNNIGGTALHLHRGGRDESTFGPILDLENCSFEHVGHDKRNATGAAIRLHGVQLAKITNSSFVNCKPTKLWLAVGEPVIEFKDCNYFESGDIISNDEAYKKENLTHLAPETWKGEAK